MMTTFGRPKRSAGLRLVVLAVFSLLVGTVSTLLARSVGYDRLG